MFRESQNVLQEYIDTMQLEAPKSIHQSQTKLVMLVMNNQVEEAKVLLQSMLQNGWRPNEYIKQMPMLEEFCVTAAPHFSTH